MPFCDPHKITVVIADRSRPADPKEVEAMCKSIKEIGQLQPILVDNCMNLIAGLHRLEACRTLDREVWYETETDGRLILNNPILRKVAELQENFRRNDLTPAQRNIAIAETERLMRELYGSAKAGKGLSVGGEWTQEETAKKLGFKSHRTVSDAIAISKAIEVGVPGVAQAKTITEQLSIIKKQKQLEASQEVARRRAEKGLDDMPDPGEFFGNKIILGDCLEGMRKLQDGICSLFVTDPPWRIEADERIENYGSATQKTSGTYDDSSEEIIPLIKDVITEMYRVGKTDCYAVMFCGAAYWLELAEHAREVGFQAYSKPLVWVKTGNNNGLCLSKSPAPTMWPASVTDFILLLRKGKALLAQLHKGDAFLHPPIATAERIHRAQKPVGLMEEIISRFYHPNSNPLLIDPFCGSGSTLAAARRVGITQYFGYELSKQNRDLAVSFLINQYAKDQEESKGREGSIAIEIDEFE
jgi:DNA modification methylase